MLRTSILAGALLVQSVICHGELVPDGRNRTNIWRWAGAGPLGGITLNRPVWTNLVDMGADNTGATDIGAILQSALNSCPSNHAVYLPPGTYLLSSAVNIPSYVTLRGATNGTLIIATNAGKIYLGPASVNSEPLLSISSGADKFSQSVTLSSVTPILVGEHLRFCIPTNEMGPHVVKYGLSGYPLLGQTVLVTNVSGNTIEFTPPLSWDFTTANSQVMPMPMARREAGIEWLEIEKAPTGGGFATVEFKNAHKCWIYGVVFRNCPTRSTGFSYSSHCEVRRCYYNNDRTPAPGGGDGITFAYANSACLVADNIFYKCEPGIKFGDGLDFTTLGNSGNVLAYNFFARSNFDNENHWSVVSLNHGYHNWGNLWEGNVVNGYVQDDGYFGSSSHAFFFRNRLAGFSELDRTARKAISFNRWSYTNTVVGNVLGRPVLQWHYSITNSFPYSSNVIFHLGFPNMGNHSFSGVNESNIPSTNVNALDLMVAKTMFEHRNYDYANNAISSQPGYDTDLPASMFLDSAPAWWGSMAWPPVDPTNPNALEGATNTIPAMVRYFTGEDDPGDPPDPPASSVRVVTGEFTVNRIGP